MLCDITDALSFSFSFPEFHRAVVFLKKQVPTFLVIKT
jgi:hypothetical protein